MTALEQAVTNALNSQGNRQEDVNKAYLEFIKANFIIPVHKQDNHIPSAAIGADVGAGAESSELSAQVLFLQENGHCFLPVFTEFSYLSTWANEINNEINILRLSGVDLLKGIGSNVTVCLNIGTPTYKEFSPQELARMQGIVAKLFKKN